jgi:hypothetical protein
MRVRVQNRRLRLPEEAGSALDLATEDEIEVEIVQGGVLLRPTGSSGRARALGKLHRAQASVRLSRELESLNPGARDKAIAALLKADKADERRRAKGRS